MNLRICRQKHLVHIIILLVLSIILLACQTVSAPTPTRWEIETKRTGLVRFEIANIQLQILNEKILVISGKVNSCDYQEETIQTRTNYRVDTYHPFFIPVQEINSFRETENLGKKWISYNLKNLNIFIPPGTGTGSVAEVLSDGSFRTTISLNKKYYFTIPIYKNKYYSVKAEPYTEWIYIQPKGITGFEKTINLPKLYYLELDNSLTRNYWKSMFQEVIIEVRDKSTRIPISALIQVTGISVPTQEEYLRIFTKEYEDINIAKAELLRIPNYLQQGQIYSNSNYSIKFIAPIGSKYKVETINSQYYYFSGLIEISKETTTKKTVLVVDKGKKITIENFNSENQGEIIETK